MYLLLIFIGCHKINKTKGVISEYCVKKSMVKEWKIVCP